MNSKSLLTSLSGAVCVMTITSPAAATAETRTHYDMPSQDLGTALRRVGQLAGVEIMFTPADVSGLIAPRLNGDFTLDEVLNQLLAGTGLAAQVSEGTVIIRGRSQAAAPSTAASTDIVVTGSRINGAPPAAPVTVISSEDIRNAGQADLGEVARSLPMNFGGGQNPGLSFSGGAANQNTNFNGSSTFNLRGIGPNATLTLLNGNRLSYSGTSAAVDVSAIPIAAVDRVEIVADGASAIYGADAVAGVVNIILKHDYSGASASARLGASTDGGDFGQQFSGVAGARWASGGVIATYDFLRNTAIHASDRSYTYAANPDTDIYPELTRQSFLLSGHQSIGDGITLSADMIFKTGEMHNATGYLSDRPITDQGVVVRRPFESFAFVPTAKIDLPGGWTSKLSATYGTDDTSGYTYQFSAGAFIGATPVRYDNKSKSVEASAQGPLFRLPAGDVRLAIGAGYRRNDFLSVLPTLTVSRHRNNAFAYAEAFVPLVSPQNGISLVRRASLSGAVRVEDYSDSSRIATPKIGFIYQPFEALTLKASWGKSYKLPTLYQQYSGYAAVLLPASGYGNTFPADATFIYALGANEHDKAERSENLTLSGEFKPLSGLDLSLSYFRINYLDRVAQPLTSFVGALTNPLYADFVTFNPTVVQQSALIGGATQGNGLQNATGGPYDSARVVAILDGRDRNVARQWYRGVDAALHYRWRVGPGQTLAVSGAATWLHSRQQLLAGQPTTPLAGTIFNPPHFKARGGATYDSGRASLSAFLNYVGPVFDLRRPTAVEIHSLTTLDLTGRVRVGHRTEISLSALNVLNAKPDAIYTTATYDTPFDATNYSATGRFISLTVTRAW